MKTSGRLVLFDIDATLITTAGAGVAAMADAGRELYGPGFAHEHVAFAGRLDPRIVADLLAANHVPWSPAEEARFRGAYRRHLARRLNGVGHRALPGVLDLLARLRTGTQTLCGLLTGNYPETGVMKLRACGIEPEWFAVRVWGTDAPRHPPAREHLVPVAMDRWRTLGAHPVHPRRVVIVGDTPHDMHCAQVHGCGAIGVATGAYDAEALRRAGAHCVFPDLSNVTAVIRTLEALTA